MNRVKHLDWRKSTRSGQNGGNWNIYGQRYNINGSPVGGQFQVNTYTTNNQKYPVVANLCPSTLEAPPLAPGSRVLGRSLTPLASMAERPRRCSPGHGDPLAARALSSILAIDLTSRTRPASYL